MSCMTTIEGKGQLRAYILSTKRNAMFLFTIFGVRIIDFKNCFNSVVLPSNKDLDCIVSS